MVKIKRKVEMTLPELIQWGWDNDIRNKMIDGNYGSASAKVLFSASGDVLTDSYVAPDETFTVEIEEEITEETKVPKLISIDRDTQNEININFNCNIKQLVDRDDYNYYYLNDDGTMTLIWKDGAMVE